MNERGFTLLEVLIALFILAIISFGTYQILSNTFILRDKIQHQGEFYNGVRLAFSILERDLSLAYSPNMMLPAKKNTDPAAPPDAGDLDAIMRNDRRVDTEYWGPVVDKTGVRLARFVGTDVALSFVAASRLRVYRESFESEFVKIRYELRRDGSLAGADSERRGDTQVLVKIADPDAFNLEHDDGAEKKIMPILHGLKSVKISYFKKDRLQWMSSWDSSKEEFGNRFPDAIRIQMTLEGDQTPEFETDYLLRPEIPIYGVPTST